MPRNTLPTKLKERRRRDASLSSDDDRNHGRETQYGRDYSGSNDRGPYSQIHDRDDTRVSVRGVRAEDHRRDEHSEDFRIDVRQEYPRRDARLGDPSDIKGKSRLEDPRDHVGPTCFSSGCLMLPFFEGARSLRDVSCPCGKGYWNIFRQEFINGERVRNGQEDERSVYQVKVDMLGQNEVEARLRDQYVEHFSRCPETEGFSMDDLAQKTRSNEVQRAIADWKRHRGRSQSLESARNTSIDSTNDSRRPAERPEKRYHSAKPSGDSGYATSTSIGTSARTNLKGSQEYLTGREVEMLIARALKEQGRSNVSKVQFERLVDEYMDRNSGKVRADGDAQEERSRDARAKGAR